MFFKLQYIDEKWLKIQGKWHYWFVVLEAKTELPILTSLLESGGKWACWWIGCQLKRLGQIPKVVITDGMEAYRYIKEGLWRYVNHLLCHFHHHEATSRWVKKEFDNGGEEKDKEVIKERKKELKKVLQTNDKRTVKRRFERLKENREELGIQGWIENTEKILPKLLPAIGSKKFPKTNNVIE